MDEKDLNGKLSQAPILSPETVALKRPEASDPSDAELHSEEPEKASVKNHRGTKILIGSAAVLLLAGAVTLAVLAKTGAFSKETEENKKPEITSEETESEETESEETESTDPTTESAESRKSINSLSQVTDQQFEFMDQHARDFIRIEGDGYPDDVVIDGMYCLGMLRQISVYTGDTDTEQDMVQMVYQVQVTDNTGDTPVKRQFFWMYGFPNVYQDGTVAPINSMSMWYLQCFDNWTARGCKDLDHLLRHAEQMYSVVENGIDYSLVQPFEGEEDADYSLVTSMDQITPAMEREFQKAGEEWLYIAGIHTGSKAKGVVVDKVEYAGLALAVSYNKSMNRVYVIYKLDVTDQNQTDPVSRSVYWYVGLSGIYEGGEIQTASCEDTAHDVWSLADWVDDLATIDDLRECIQHRECSGWSYEDNF